MRSNKSIELIDVSVRYPAGDVHKIGIKDYVIQKIRGQYKSNDFWAVDGICFTLENGDMLGIIGKNGAGKSTLLKAIAGIKKPSSGTMKIHGSITSLLELGIGFDNDLTVKENTFLLGALFGYQRDFMHDMYDGIIEFAELSQFQNNPIRQLSSGMKSRLAFSVACLTQPDVLLLDEILAVGDTSFQSKSEGKLREIMTSGATTLFVSHSIGQIKKLCNKVLWIEKGKQMAFGDVNEICDMYESFLKGQ